MSQSTRSPGAVREMSAFEQDFRRKIPYTREENQQRYEAYEKLIPVLEARKPSDRPRIVVITDVEQDYDDLLAIIFLSEMHHLGAVELAGLITNHGDPLKRAKFLRTVMHLLDMGDIQVAEGTVALWPPEKARDYRPGYYELKNTTFENQSWNKPKFLTGYELLENLAQEVDKGKEPLTVLLISSLHDISEYFRVHEDDPAFLKRHFRKFVSQGGYTVNTDPATGACNIAPVEQMFNNASHIPSARHFTKCLAKYGLPSDAWSKEAAVAATLDGSVFTEAVKYGPIGRHLQWLRERQEFKFYWDPYNAPFRSWLDPSWFLRIRCAMDPKSEKFFKFSKSPPSFREALPEIKVIVYDGCAAMGAVGDDIMRALGIMGDDIKVPEYNKAAHQHRIFGAGVGDLGGISGEQLGSMFEVFLLGALKRTKDAAEGLIPSDSVEHQVEQYRVGLHIFKHQVPFLKEGNTLAEKTKNQKISESEREQANKALKTLKSEFLPGELGNWPKVPAILDIPYELLYQEAKRQGRAEEEREALEGKQRA
ncbi:hypothetical protein B0T16DRAFT_417193 [Cercophora newfieldiana]|uniref:Inosine/uridine-preferring nucleoside hydrolase domain-containing protein n=1 Tax=Cercophora newfieldiana TaxID=92897 RepID=A0AA39Y429_9PEZI|nr:hypothetical protein B0T16DRAFT_417193 [Cercophora newfieldiana]